MFGRKGLNQAAPQPRPQSSPAEHPSHEAVLNTLRREEAAGNINVRAQLAGRVLFDDLYFRIAQPERGTRIEDLLAILGACGGFACIVAVHYTLKLSGQSPKDIGMMVAEGRDGRTYYFGDVPNTLLLESEHALLSLALGAAHGLGAPVTLERVHAVMKHVAATVGTEEFGASRIAEPHRPVLPMREAIAAYWPAAKEALDLYQVLPQRRPSAFGFAVQIAMERAKDVLDPLLAADIVTDAAVPAAKIDPKDFGFAP
ncbi:hypothetical protein H8M03_00390 [Sphingomonas sabuli]|uniref:Uncharacterized protein n=1 Tax=Sphingomonas sabuli TaxID=2764186 RepID=A0A7G9L2M1_9SPHN|nr:hypothetical protein [Sphingomonas sabuli]QNM82870.1 hypothetical protein H8M03_00390 [Sphingomonas sabuli]